MMDNTSIWYQEILETLVFEKNQSFQELGLESFWRVDKNKSVQLASYHRSRGTATRWKWTLDASTISGTTSLIVCAPRRRKFISNSSWTILSESGACNLIKVLRKTNLQNLKGMIDPFDAICRECVQEWPSYSHWKNALDPNMIRTVLETRTRSHP